MSRARRIWTGLLVSVAHAVLKVFWASCRVRIVGAEHLQRLKESDQPAVITYWHQHHLFVGGLLLREAGGGLPLAFLASRSVSGEVPAGLIRRWGAVAVRGSSTRSAGEALRDMYEVVAGRRLSLAITVDGPKGPVRRFKPGAVLLAKMSRSPILPVCYVARRGFHWPSWDRFLVPMPFTRVVIAVGEPVQVPRDLSLADPSPFCRQLERQLEALEEDADRRCRTFVSE